MSIPGILGTAFDLALVILGFGLIVFVHELGHFLAARWAGIRVLAFALGFGPAMVSYRKGLGWRRGSSEPEYIAALRSPDGAATAISPTEYRLNALPFGGYVKMLGQEDLNPRAASAAPDSYQNAKPWKRMVVISAGVIMNMITAATLFVIVFMVGLKTEPPKIGDVAPGKPASLAIAANARELGVTSPGLEAGDEIVLINGAKPRSFNDLMLAVAMAKRGTDVRLSVRRDGVPAPLEFTITPERSVVTNLMEIGVEPARSTRVFSRVPEPDRPEFMARLAERGLPGVAPGMTMVSAGGREVRGGADLSRAMRDSGGQPVEVVFADDAGARTTVTLRPRAELQSGLVGQGGTRQVIEHVLGLTPVMRVADAGTAKGLKDGDIFARLGSTEFPNLQRGIAEIRARRGKQVEAVVLRADAEGKTQRVPLTLEVTREGRLGIGVGDTAADSTLLSLPPETVAPLAAGAEARATPASGVITRPGSRLVAINGEAVADFGQIVAALRRAVDASPEVMLTLELPLRAAESPVTQEVRWTLDERSIADVRALGWSAPIAPGTLFEVEEFTLKASGPADALRAGLHETHRVMMMTYLTFARLFDGTVKVEHLKGPVGIAHLGTMVASRGFIWLLFFMALISVNLAVLNFLPLPIVDGGQFVFLLVEQAMGKPVPIVVQNAATVAGLALIGSMFLIVTFNDIMNLVRP